MWVVQFPARMFPTWSIQKTFPLSFPSYLHFCCVSHRNNTQWRTSKSWASTKKTVKWFNFKKGNELQRAEQILKKTVKWFNFKKGRINLITEKFASSLSFVLKNKTKRNCEKYSQTGITVKIPTNKAGARAKAIMLRSIAARSSRQSPVIAVKQASEITSAA